MIPPALLSEIADCSDAERSVLWLAVAELLAGLKKGRAFGRNPGRDNRDYIREAADEMRDGLLWFAMHQIQRAAAASPVGSEAAQPSARETVMFTGNELEHPPKASRPLQSASAYQQESGAAPTFTDASGPTWTVPTPLATFDVIDGEVHEVLK